MAFVEPIAEAMERNLNVDNEYTILQRPISPSDPNRSICIFPDSWAASQEDKLIGVPNREPFQNTYKLVIQNSLIHGDSIEGRYLFSLDSKAIRAILYRDATFHVALTSQVETFMGSTERVLKYDVLRQEFMASRMTVGFMYLAKTEFVVITEVTQ
jgi:hypothetical protein